MALNNNSRNRIIFASMIGTTIEFYDFYIYATAAVSVFPLLFFPTTHAGASLLASMATFGVAFVARPLGSIIFGHFGDRVGRKATLVGSLLTMGLATFTIGLLPTAYQIGVFAPILLTILRFCQGLGLGGEWSGAALLATETAEKGKRAWAAMWPQLGAPIGLFLADGFFLLLTWLFDYTAAQATIDHEFVVWGWRIPFLMSFLMVFLGLYVRIKLTETPVFSRAIERGEKLKAPLVAVIKDHTANLALGTIIPLSMYCTVYLMTTWILSYGIGNVDNGYLGISYQRFLELQLISVIFCAAAIPIAGKLADRFGRRPVMICTTLAIFLYGLSFGAFLNPEIIGTGVNANIPLMFAFLCIGFTLMGLSFGPMSAILPELFPTNVRYTGSGISYNLSSIFGAGFTPFIAVWLTHNFGVDHVGYYLSGLAVLSGFALLMTRETRDLNLENLESRATSVAIETTSP